MPDRHPKTDLGKEINTAYNRDMTELENLARNINGNRHNVVILFSGNTSTGLRWSVDCDDDVTGKRILEFFNQWKIQQDEF